MTAKDAGNENCYRRKNRLEHTSELYLQNCSNLFLCVDKKKSRAREWRGLSLQLSLGAGSVAAVFDGEVRGHFINSGCFSR
jgi:hypothetical protein